MRRLLFLFALVLVTTGCVNTSSYHSARPIAEGTTEIGVALEATTSLSAEGNDILLAQPRVIARRGLTSTSDIGLSGGPSGTSFDYNYMIVDSSPFALSLNPTLYVAWEAVLPDTISLGILPFVGVLADLQASDTVTFTFGLKPGFLRQAESSPSRSSGRTTGILAASLGLRLDLDSVVLFPEANLIYNFAGGNANNLLTFGMGISF